MASCCVEHAASATMVAPELAGNSIPTTPTTQSGSETFDHASSSSRSDAQHDMRLVGIEVTVRQLQEKLDLWISATTDGLADLQVRCSAATKDWRSLRGKSPGPPLPGLSEMTQRLVSVEQKIQAQQAQLDAPPPLQLPDASGLHYAAKTNMTAKLAKEELMTLTGKLEGLSLDLNRHMTATNNVINDLKQGQKVHGTDLTRLAARLDRAEGRQPGRSPRHSSPTISSDMAQSRNPTPSSRFCQESARDGARPRQNTPVPRDTNQADILVQTVADMPESKSAWTTPATSGLSFARACRAHRNSSEIRILKDESGVQAAPLPQEDPVPFKGFSGLVSPPTVLQRCASPLVPAPPPQLVAKALNSTSATPLLAPTASPPQVYRQPRQSQALAEQCFTFVPQKDGNVHPGALGRTGHSAEFCPNMALAVAGTLQRGRTLRPRQREMAAQV